MIVAFVAGISTLMYYREIFAISEDDSSELDHSADSENGKFADAISYYWAR